MKPEKRTRTKTLDVESVCRIINTCAGAGVAKLSFGPLHLEFLRQLGPYDPSDLHPTDTAISARADSIEKDTLERDELKLKEEQLAFSVVEDPLGFENALLSEDLEDADAETD